MKIQSTIQLKLNNTTYLSNPNVKFDFNNQFNIVKDEFSVNEKLKKEINFGASMSIDSYARKYQFCSNFEESLMADLWSNEVSLGQAIGDFFTNKATDRVNNMYNQIIDRISELEEIDRRQREQARWSSSYSRSYSTSEYKKETQKLSEEKAQVEREIKLKNINSKKEKLALEKSSLVLEEKNIELEKELLQEQKFSDYSDVLKAKFINLSKHEKESSIEQKNIFPNGIMLSGSDQNLGDELIQWTAKKSDSNLNKIDFAKLTQNEVINNLNEMANKAHEHYYTGKNGVFVPLPNETKVNCAQTRTLIHIENFDKYTTDTKENEKIIPKLKAFLSNCAEKYKCTIITQVENPKGLAQEIIADQRFKIKLKI